MPMKRYPGGATVEMRYVDAPIVRVNARAEGAEPTYEIAISSEYEVERHFYGVAWREQLSHDKGAVQLARFRSGSAPFLVDHDTREQVGVIENARVDSDKVLRANVRWSSSERAQAIRKDVDEKIRKNISVGYLPKRWKLIEEDTEKGDLWRALLWEPVEASSVPIPADPTVGVGRGHGGSEFYPVETEEEGRHMKKKVFDTRGQLIEVDESDPREAAHPDAIAVRAGSPAPPPESGPKRNRDAEIAEIVGLCEANKVSVRADWITAGLTPDQYGRKLLEEMATKATAQPGAEAVAVELSERDAAKYSYARAILISAGMNRKRGVTSDEIALRPDGLEWEMHREIERKMPENYRYNGGVFVPVRLGGGRQTRTLDSMTAGKGSETVFERPGEFIEMFRNASCILRSGARQLTGLVGPIAFPKQTGGMTFYWMPENGGVDVTGSDVTFGLVTLQPKTLMGTTKYSRQLLAQAPSGGVDIENMVRQDMADGHGLEFDRVGLHGTGTSGQPTGVFNAPDVLTTTLSAPPTWAEIVAFLSKIAAVNAPTANLGWITTPEAAGKFMSTPKDAALGVGYLWEGTITEGRMGGYKAMATNQVSKLLGTGAQHGVVAGTWNECLIGMWGAMELLADPYAFKKQGLIEVASFQMGDLIFRHGQAFCTSVITP
ncbi:MAG: hypothetical protein A2V88_02610 [Elusimicrobia bacterium RBG_16_66_12]|nr:MAG: hypothetical protein A2V88_02610 [Elusimicrobia bacterium RBG_16_66_12]